MTGHCTIRRLRASDREAWQHLWDQYLSFYRAELPARTSDRTFARLCEPDGDVIGLLAIPADGAAAGLAHLVLHATTWAETPTCYLQDLFVERRLRGAGVATRLIGAVYEHARKRGASQVYWHTQQFNAPARSLYDTLGQLTSFVVYSHEL